MDSATATVISACVVTLVPTAAAYFSSRATRMAAAKDAKATADKIDVVAHTASDVHSLVDGAASEARRAKAEDTATIKALTDELGAMRAQVATLTSILVTKTND
jgi:hypothetical protein